MISERNEILYPKNAKQAKTNPLGSLSLYRGITEKDATKDKEVQENVPNSSLAAAGMRESLVMKW